MLLRNKKLLAMNVSAEHWRHRIDIALARRGVQGSHILQNSTLFLEERQHPDRGRVAGSLPPRHLVGSHGFLDGTCLGLRPSIMTTAPISGIR